MKNRILALILLAGALFGALPTNTTTFELRSLGADANGGCYITGSSGTDFSQQNAAQFSGTDLVLVTSTTVSSITHNFVATDVGNCIHITAGTGFTAGFYNIVSVLANVATLGTAAGTMGSTGGTWAEGGAIASPITAALAANVGGVTIYCKADGTYTVTAPVIFAIDNGGFNPTRVIGYTTTRTDNGRCSWTTATNSTDLIQPGGAGTTRDLSLYNLNLSSTAGTPGDGYHTPSRATNNLLFDNCVFSGFKIAIEGNAGATDTFYSLTLSNTEIKSSTGLGVDTSNGLYSYGSYIHNNAGGGVLLRANSAGAWQSVFISTIISTNTGQGIEQSDNTGNSGRGFAVISSAIYANTGDGIKLNTTGGGIPFQSINTVYWGNGGFGINSTGTLQGPASAVIKNNGFGSNTSGNTQNVQGSTGTSPVTLTSDPFTSSTNFALNATAGGGAALKGVGFPGVLNAGGTGHIDIGPLQSAAGGGGGGQINAATAQ